MGNCLFGGLGDMPQLIKVTTSNGGVMEFSAPITVDSITDEFPSHGIFRSHDLFWKPLSPNEELVAGHSYYLLPLNGAAATDSVVREGHVRSNSIPTTSVVAPYRMSFDYQGRLKRSYTDVFCRYNNNRGLWKVKLVISPEQLVEILSKEGATEELIESVRTVAKCSNGVANVGLLDQWSSTSGRNYASSKIEGLV